MNTAHIYWLLQSARDVPGDDDWLSPGELDRVSSLAFPKRRAEWRLGRWTAKRAVSAYLSGGGLPTGMQDLEIRAAADGAPETFVKGEAYPVSISISHSSGFSLCAVAAHELAIGCDLEAVEPRSLEFLADYLASDERKLLTRVAPADIPLFATVIWCAKESALKVVRQGLRRDTRSMVVRLNPTSPESGWKPLTIRCAESSIGYPGWWQPLGEFVLAVSADAATAKPVGLHLPESFSSQREGR